MDKEIKDLVDYGMPEKLAVRVVACAIIAKKPTRYIFGALKKIRERSGCSFFDALENFEFSQVEKRATRAKFAPWGVEWAAGRNYDQFGRVDIKISIENELAKAKMLGTFTAYLSTGSKAAERKLYRAGIAAALLRRQYLALTSE